MNIAEVSRIAIKALVNAKRSHDELRDEGLVEVQKNNFGETALRGDIECERAIFEVLSQHQLPIRIISEEHGVTDLDKNPIFLGVVDGIDGSGNYRKARGKGGYGTLLGIFSKLNPNYRDYLFSGIMEHATGSLYYAVPNQDALRIDVASGKIQLVKTSGKTQVEDITMLYHTLGYNEVSQRYIGGIVNLFPSRAITSCAATYIELASGLADAVIEVTRKSNLEQMVAFGLIERAGGAVLALDDGESLAGKDYFSFGQKESTPIIMASSRELALRLRDRVLATLQ